MGKFKQGEPPSKPARPPEDTHWLDGAWAAETARRAEAKKPENTYDNQCVGFEGDQVNVASCFGVNFSYPELMSR